MELLDSRKAAVILLLLILIIFCFPEALFFDKVFTYRDLGRYFYPLRFYTVSTLKAGMVPLWNPYILCGAPHLALQQSAVFYPVSLIYYIMPFDIAYNLFVIFHVFLIGFFTYLLARQWGFKHGAALLSGLTFMLSGYVISILNLVTTLSGVAWLPLALLFFDRALINNSRRDLSLSAVFLGVMFLGGEPGVFYITAWILFFYSAFSWFYNRKIFDVRKVSFCFLIVTISGVLLSSVQLLPFLELIRFTDRVSGAASFDKITLWSLLPKDTFSLLIPFITRSDFSMNAYWKEQNWVALIYVGVLAAVLIPMALFLDKRWKVKFLFFIGILFLLLAYGRYSPLYRFVYGFVPGFRFIRYPIRFLSVTIFSVAMLCGAGLDAYLRSCRSGDRRSDIFVRFILYSSFLSAVIFLSLHMYNNEVIRAGLSFLGKSGAPNNAEQFRTSYMIGLENVKRFLGFCTLGCLVFYMGRRFKMSERIFGFFLISFVLADLLTTMPYSQLVVDRESLHKAPPNIEYLMKDKALFRFYGSPKIRESVSFLRGLTIEDAVHKSQDRLCANLPMIYGLYDAAGYDSLYLSDWVEVITLLDSSGSPSVTKIPDMMNVKYVATLDEIDAKGYRLVKKSDTACIYENPRVLPRVFFADSARVIKDKEDIKKTLASKEFDPAREVILEEVPPRAAVEKSPNNKGMEKAEIAKYTPAEIVVKTVTDSPKFLVFSDKYYPGWKAYIDGKREKIYKANFILKAVRLDPGSHTVRFVFDPFTFRLGSAISLGTLGAILLVNLAPFLARLFKISKKTG